MLKRFILSIMFCLSIIGSANAGVISDYVANLKQDVSDTWSCGRLAAYVPAYAWHNRLTYDQKHIDKYNENPWGFGLGLSRYDGIDWHGLYAMGFKDSNDYLETFFGYAYLKNYALDEGQNWRVGIGYTLGITQRHEYHYIPVPVPLPIAAISYKQFSVNAAYVPGVKNDGNVLFVWLKFDF